MFAKHEATSGTTKVTLAFIVNNRHIYPVLDSLIQSISRNSHLTLAELKMTADWTDSCT